MLARDQIGVIRAPLLPNRDAATDAVRRAFDLLGRASDNWRNGGQIPEGPLHWPISVHLARHTLREALRALEGEPS